MLIEHCASLTDEFKRKYGVLKSPADSLQEDSEIKELMAKIAKVGKKNEPFSEEKFPQTICQSIANHLKDKPQVREKTIVLNAVNLDKLGPTEKAFFLAAEYHGPKSDKQLKGKDESGKLRTSETNKNSTDSKDGLSKLEEPIVSEEEQSRAAKAGLGSNNDEDKAVYCICKKPYSSSDGISIECDGICKSWYHPSCINATKIEVGLIESGVPIIWMCPTCVKKISAMKIKNTAATNSELN